MIRRVGLLIVILATAACTSGNDSDAETAIADAASPVVTAFPEEQRWLTPDAPALASITSSAAPGGAVEVILRADEYRGLAYSLQPVTTDGRVGPVEWMVLVGERGEGRAVTIENFTEIELLQVRGPRSDRFRVPDAMTPGTWRLCVAFTSEPRCSEFIVGDRAGQRVSERAARNTSSIGESARSPSSWT